MKLRILLALALAGCTDFKFAEGLRCSLGEDCPAGFFCDTTGGNVCLRELPQCNNGVLDPDEVCDDGNNTTGDGCRADCLKAEICGDGVKDPQEACDDDNVTRGDGCNEVCALEACGNGTVDEGEECDDGNSNADTAACLTTCKRASCGDGLVFSTEEECDEGVANADSAACKSNCQSARCGDGIVHVGVEDCDDENGIDGDSCPGTCKSATCGDGFVQFGTELCDDENANANDACNNACTTSKVVQVATGPNHTCILRAHGRVRCWGLGTSGQLGYGNTQTIGDDETPDTAGDVDVGGVVVQLAAGDNHTCALLDNGNVRCWGLGSTGQLGYGNTNNIGDNETPASAGDVSIGGTAVQISAGAAHTCVLFDTGSVRCWGDGNNGRLGYANEIDIGDNELPSSVGTVNVGGVVTQIENGQGHTCALLETGSVRCWGPGALGIVGHGNLNDIGDNETPASAGDVPIGGTAIQISAGGAHTCVVLDTGNVRCWGSGDSGKTGYASTENIGDNELPSSAGDVDVGGKVVRVAAGISHTCALLIDGKVRCWGAGATGRLGYGNQNAIGDAETPATAGDVPVGGVAVQVDIGAAHSCALLVTGDVRCWGSAVNGRIGYGNAINIGDDEFPSVAGNVSVIDPVQIAAGSDHTCAVLDSGLIRCWGQSDHGQLGYGNTTTIGDNETPADIGFVLVGGVATRIATGSSHTCAVLDTGSVRCWGRSNFGQLGYGNTVSVGDTETPASAGDVNVGGRVVGITAGAIHSCALLDTGAVRCWGSGTDGRLAYGNTNNIGDNETPASAGDVVLGGNAIQIVAGGSHTCALLDTGNVRCWGRNSAGQLGYGNINNVGDDETPASAGDVQVGGTVVKIAAGAQQTCAVLTTGSVRCWGEGSFGRLGYVNTTTIGDDEFPSAAGDVNIGGPVAQVAGGALHMCARLVAGGVRCWGFGGPELGYLNNINIGDDETPASAGDVAVGGRVVNLTAGADHTCAVLEAGNVRCWGTGDDGKLGYGNTNSIGDNETPANAGDVPLF